MSAMPAQLGQVATAMNFKSADVLGEALRNGKVSMNEFMNTLIELNEKGANGFPSLAEQAKNATGGLQTSIENMKTSITRGVADMITSINEGLESAGFGTIQDIVMNIGTGLENMLGNIGNFVGQVIILLSPIFNAIQQIWQFISDNWSIIAPIVLGIIGVLGIYYAQIMLVKIATGIWTIAQNILNAALYACPLTWILIIIIAIIAIIYAVVAAINKLTGSSTSATGIIVGALTAAVAFIWNLFLGLLDFMLGIVNAIINPWIKFANFFANLFNDPIGAIIHLFGDMADQVLGILESIAKAIDKVFGSNLAGAVQGWRSGLDGAVEKVANKYGNGSYEKIAEELNLSSESLGLKRWNYGDAWNTGYNWGQGIDTKISSMFNFKKNNSTDNYNDILNNINDNLNTTNGNTANTAGNTGKISDTLDATEEDLQYLRDIAERETINRFTTAEINVDFTSHNNINSEMDIDGIVDSLGEKLEERLEVVAEGVYI